MSGVSDDAAAQERDRPRTVGRRYGAPGAVVALQWACRILLALFFITYGIAKLMGTQFIRSGPVLDFHIAEASGFELTWAYFGYSVLYSHFIALGQIGFAAMLLFNRTLRIGTIGLATIAANIVLVNFAYDISTATTIVSLVFLSMLGFLLATDFPALKRFFWDEPGRQATARTTRVGTAILGVALIGGFGFISFIRSMEHRTPLLHGDWTVQEILAGDAAVVALPGTPDTWEKVYFAENGLFGIRTDRGIVAGRFVAEGDSLVNIHFYPYSHRRDRPLPSEAELSEYEVIELALRYQVDVDGQELVLAGMHRGEQLAVRLRPWRWNQP